MRTLHRAWRGGRGEWRTHLVTALSSSVAFLCLAFALLMVVNLRNLQQRWENVGRLSAYLIQEASPEEVKNLSDALATTPGVEAVTYLSSQQARAQLLSDTVTSVLKALPIEAFPPSIEVSLTDGHSAEDVAAITTRLSKLRLVESIETYDAWSSRVSRFVGVAMAVALGLALVVFFAVITTVSSSTSLMLERRRDEVEVLRIVGATTAYVRRPFMLEGAVQGALGAAGAVTLAAVGFFTLASGFDEQLTVFLGAAPTFLPWFVSAALVVCGALLGAFAALGSLRKASLV